MAAFKYFFKPLRKGGLIGTVVGVVVAACFAGVVTYMVFSELLTVLASGVIADR